MQDNTQKSAQPKQEWQEPKLVELDLDMYDIKTQYDAGVDALMFGMMTSMS